MKPWSGYHLRIATTHFRPYNYPIPDEVSGKMRIHGYIGAVLDNVTTAMNMTYSVYPPKDGTYGNVDVDESKMIGMTRMVLDGEADIAAGPFPEHPLNFRYFHSVTNIDEVFSSFSIITGMTKQYVDSPTGLIGAFDTSTWWCILGAFIMVHLTFFFRNVLTSEPDLGALFTAFTKWMFAMFAMLLQEATSEKPPKTWFERVFLGLWLLVCMLLSYMFLGAMRANLIVLTPTLRIDNLDQLLDHPQLAVLYSENTPAVKLINEVPGELGRRLNEQVKQNSRAVPTINHLLTNDIRDALGQSRGAVLMEVKFMLMGISRWCDESPYSFYVGKEEAAPLKSVVLASKALPPALRAEFDMRIMWVNAFGVPFLRQPELLLGKLDCLATTDKKTSEEMKAVQLYDLYVVFIMLVMGYGFAVVMFIIEMVYYYFVREIMERRYLRMKQVD